MRPRPADAIGLTVRRLESYPGFVAAASVLMVIVFAGLASSSVVGGFEVASGPGWAPGLVPEPIPASLQTLEWTDAVRTLASAQETASGKMALLTSALLLLVVLSALLGLAGLWSEEAAVRRTEVAVHRAVGARRGRVVWDRFLETWILLAVAAVLGSCIGIGVRLGVTETWPGLTRDVAPVFGGALIAGLVLVTLARGLTLSLQATPAGVLGERSSLADPGEGLAGRGILVVAQLAVVTCLLFAVVSLAGDPGGAEVGLVDGGGLPGPAPVETDRVTRFAIASEDAPRNPREALGAVSGLPGVRSVGFAGPGTLVALGPAQRVITDCGRCFVGGLPVPFRGKPLVHHVVSTDTFRILGFRPVAGRVFDDGEGESGARVAVVSRDFAARHFEGGDAVGRRLRLGHLLGAEDGWYTVVGVVEDSRRWVLGAREQPEGEVYLSAGQQEVRRGDLLVEWDAESGVQAQELPPRENPLRDVRAGDARRGEAEPQDGVTAALAAAGFRVDAVEGVPEHLARHADPIRWFSAAWSAVAIAAFIVALFGVYVTIRLRTERETREIGIRRAVGARPRAVLARYLRDALRLCVPGIGGGVWLGLFVVPHLPFVPTVDPGLARPIVAVVVLPVAAAALAGALVPAWRASRVTPVEALRGGGP